MTTPATGGLITISQVCARLPGRTSGRLNPSTVTRWILSGCRARSGDRVKLRAVRVGARWLVAADELDRFFAALAATGPEADSPSAAGPTAGSRGRAASTRAAEELARRGA